MSESSVILGISGSIAAYKAVLVARLLLKAGVRVRPVMTASASRFVGPSTLSGLCGEPVHSAMFVPEHPGELHVELAAEADLLAIVPTTADTLAGLAHGRADNLLLCTALCFRGPLLLAPAMHPRMWDHPATAANVATLRDRGCSFVGPIDGEVASGDRGLGRMAEPEAIAAAILGALRSLGTTAVRDLAGRHIVVSAGPTVEDIDPARYLSNRSSGKMGFALAERAAARGATVTLVAGPVCLPTPVGVKRVDVRSAAHMAAALDTALGEDLAAADALIMTAAVADYRPAQREEQKIKRSAQPQQRTLELVANADILAGLGKRRSGSSPYLVGFALETVADDALVAVARGKLQRKGVDLVVANLARDAFEKDDNRATLVTADNAVACPRMPKRQLADRILDHVGTALEPVGAGAKG